jgi:hypothetical protein
MASRKKVKRDIETEILLRCARRCALCYYLNNDLREKVGQVAHIDQDPSHSTEDNLVFLCMEHHTLYDSKTSQHKNYTAGELREMKTVILGAIAAKEHFKQPEAPKIIRRKKPKLNVVYTIGQAAWSIGGQMQPTGRMKKMMQISFWAIFTTDGDEPVLVLEAYPEGTNPILSATVHRIEPKRLNRIMVSAFVLPILGTVGEPLKVRFILKDQYGQEYKTPKTEFRFISSGIEKQLD